MFIILYPPNRTFTDTFVSFFVLQTQKCLTASEGVSSNRIRIIYLLVGYYSSSKTESTCQLAVKVYSIWVNPSRHPCDRPVARGVSPARRGPRAVRVIGGRAAGGWMWCPAEQEQRSLQHSAAEARCLVSQFTSEMSGWRCRAGTPPTPSGGSDTRLWNVTRRTNQTTAASLLWRTLGLSSAGARVWVCWTRMTPSRMYWRIMTLWRLVMTVCI